jgi:hypothetical protein
MRMPQYGTSVVEEFFKMLESPDKEVSSDSANRLPAAPWVVAPARYTGELSQGRVLGLGVVGRRRGVGAGGGACAAIVPVGQSIVRERPKDILCRFTEWFTPRARTMTATMTSTRKPARLAILC